jgi:hypothetical protein
VNEATAANEKTEDKRERELNGQIWRIAMMLGTVKLITRAKYGDESDDGEDERSKTGN